MALNIQLLPSHKDDCYPFLIDLTMKQTRSVPPRAADVLRELDFISRTTVLFLFCMNLDVIILQHWLYFFNYGKIYLQYIYLLLLTYIAFALPKTAVVLSRLICQ